MNLPSLKLSNIGSSFKLGTAGAVSYTTIGAGIGLLGGAPGAAAGAVIGAVIDLGVKFFGDDLKKAKKRMRAAFYASLQKRYNNQIFVGCIEEIGSSMLYIQELGLKPTNPDGTLNSQFDAMLRKKLNKGPCVYNGNCNIAINSVDPQGNLQPVATLNSDGTIQAYNRNVNLDNGPRWKQACHDLTLAAYQAWAQDYRDNVIFQQQLQEDQTAETRSIITKVLVNAGLILLILGYILREKHKIGELREYKAQLIHKQATTN